MKKDIDHGVVQQIDLNTADKVKENKDEEAI